MLCDGLSTFSVFVCGNSRNIIILIGADMRHCEVYSGQDIWYNIEYGDNSSFIERDFVELIEYEKLQAEVERELKQDAD